MEASCYWDLGLFILEFRFPISRTQETSRCRHNPDSFTRTVYCLQIVLRFFSTRSVLDLYNLIGYTCIWCWTRFDQPAGLLQKTVIFVSWEGTVDPICNFGNHNWSNSSILSAVCPLRKNNCFAILYIPCCAHTNTWISCRVLLSLWKDKHCRQKLSSDI